MGWMTTETKEASQRISLMKSLTAVDDGVTKDEFCLGTISSLQLLSCPVDAVKRILEVDLQDGAAVPVCVRFFQDSLDSVDEGLAPTLDTNSQLEGGQHLGYLLCQAIIEAFRH